MIPNRIQLTVFVAASLLAISSAVSQEAVEAEKSAKAAETATPEESPSKKPVKSIEEKMRPEEFKAAGLDKLSEDELQRLDAWLQGYRQATEKKATEHAEKKASEEIKKVTQEATARTARTKLDTLVSRVDGSFEGLKGRTIIRLEDGTQWKQVNADDHYRATVTDHPAAVVLHSPFGYKMRIEGMPEFYVDPVRSP